MPIMSRVKKFLRNRIEQKTKSPKLIDVDGLRKTFVSLVENGGERGTDSEWVEGAETAGRNGASTS